MTKKTKKPNFWSDGLSIKETKFSTILLMTVIGFLYSLFAHYSKGDISANLLDLVKYLLLSVVGINGVSAVSDVLQQKREYDATTTYNGGESEHDPYKDNN